MGLLERKARERIGATVIEFPRDDSTTERVRRQPIERRQSGVRRQPTEPRSGGFVVLAVLVCAFAVWVLSIVWPWGVR
jgi:hypothetical protein